jgi:CheY-like chemotaxis protein
MDQATFFIELIKILIWPILVAFILLVFKKPISEFLGNLQKSKIKVDKEGVSLELDATKAEVVSMLGAASTSQAGNDSKKVDWGEIAKTVNRLAEVNVKKLSEIKVLWVDDFPQNNVYERRSLEALGIRFALSTSTEDALDKLKSNEYDVIISDMGRGENKQAGFDLLKETKKISTTPFIIYSLGVTTEKIRKAKEKGAFGETSSPRELFQLVIDAIQKRQ